MPELVSNGAGNGADIRTGLRMSADGEGYALYAHAGFGDVRWPFGESLYAARRSGGGWAMTPITVDLAADGRPGQGGTGVGGMAFDDTLDSVTVVTAASFDPADTDFLPGTSIGAGDVYRLTADGRVDWISRSLTNSFLFAATLAGVSGDGSTVFVRTDEALTPDVGPFAGQLYRWRDGALEAVGRTEGGALIVGGASLGSNTSSANTTATGSGGQLQDSYAVSRDGSRFVYRAGAGTGLADLYLHVDGQGSRRISISHRTGERGTPAPSGGRFLGATDDLGKVLFESPDALTDDAPVGGGGYVYDVEADALRFIAPNAATGLSNEPYGIVRYTEDVEWVYFVTSHDLADGAQPGRRNLYVKHRDAVRLVAVLDDTTSSAEWLTLNVARGNASNQAYSQSGISDDGTKLVFRSRVVGFDTADHRQIFRYDATAGSLECISCPRAGLPTADADFSARGDVRTPMPRVMSADGRRVGFVTSDPLVPSDVNGVEDVYEYVDGDVAIITSGTDRDGAWFGGMSADGEHLYLSTREKLSPLDTDNGFSDLYDARLGGSGDRAPQDADACADDACQGPPARRHGTVGIGTAAVEGNEQATPPRDRVVATDRVVRPSRAQVRRFLRGRRLVVRIEARRTGRARLRVTAAAPHRRPRAIATHRRAVVSGERHRLTVRLQRRARRWLRRQGEVRVVVRVKLPRSRERAVFAAVLQPSGRAKRGLKR